MSGLVHSVIALALAGPLLAKGVGQGPRVAPEDKTVKQRNGAEATSLSTGAGEAAAEVEVACNHDT